MRLEIGAVAVRNLSRPRDVVLPDGVLTRDTYAVVSDPTIDLVVETIGGIERIAALCVEIAEARS